MTRQAITNGLDGTQKKPAPLNRDTLKLEQYVSQHEHGAVMGWVQVEHETGVRMDFTGKQRLRQAVKNQDREYEAIRAYGIRLADKHSVMPILSTCFKRIGKAVKRTARAHKNLERDFYDALPKEDQQRMRQTAAYLGAIRQTVEQGRQVHKRQPEMTATIFIPLPDSQVS